MISEIEMKSNYSLRLDPEGAEGKGRTEEHMEGAERKGRAEEHMEEAEGKGRAEGRMTTDSLH